MKRKTKRITESIFFGILLLILGLIYWLLYTTSGLNWSLKTVNRAIGTILDYGVVEGAWLTQMQFDYLTVRTPAMDIQGDNFKLKISVKNLMSGTLDIVAAQTTSLVLKNKPSPEAEKPSTTEDQGSFALPLGIDIHSLTVEQLRFEQQDQSIFVLNHINASDSRIKNQIDIGTLNAVSPYGELTVSGSIEPLINGKLDLHTVYTLYATGEIPQLEGSGELSGTLNNLSLKSHITHPFAISLDAKLRSIDSPLYWQAQINAADAPLQTHFPQIPVTLHNVKITGEGDITRYSVKGETAVNHKEFGQWNGQWNVEKTPSQWLVDSLHLANPQTHTAVSVAGTIHSDYAFSATTGFSLQAQWQNLQWPLNTVAKELSETRQPSENIQPSENKEPGNPVLLSSKDGNLSVEGSLNDYQLNTAGMLVWSGHEISNININARGIPNELTFSQLSADVLKGTVKGSGTLAFGEKIAWRADTKLSAINLSGLNTKLETKLNGNVKINGAFENNEFNSTFLINKLKGKISNRPVAGKAQITINGSSIKVSDVALRSGDSRLKGMLDYRPGNSTRAAALNAHWDVYIHDLQLLAANLQGSVTSKGSVSGAINELTGEAKLQTSNVQFEQYKINTLNLDAKIDSNDKVPSKISLSLQQAQVSDLPVEGLQIDIGGTATRHTLDIVLAQDTQNRVTLKGFGSWKGNQWNLTIQETQMQTGQFGKWQQTQPAALKVTADDFSLALYCLHSDKQGNICGSLEAQNYRDWKGEARVQKIPFAVLKKFLPPQFDSTDVDLNGLGRFWYTPQSGAMLDFHASGENGVISGIKVEGKETPVAFNHFEFALSNVNKKLEATTSISIEDAGNIDMAISFPHWSKLGIPDLNERIQGHVEIDLTSLTVLSILSSQIKNPVGKWHGDIEISGTLNSPIIIGESRVKASSFTLATLGLELSDVDLVATADKKRNVTITGNARAGNGSINISGTLNDYRAAEPTGSIKISGKNFELVRIPEATIIVSPDLSLTLNQNAVSMTGDILISEADLKIFTPTKSITPSPDVVIVSEQKTQKTNAPLNISSKIRIILGDNVKVQGYGFTGRLHGSVLVDDTKELTTASGEINIVEGKYAAYGTTLDIARGSLSFAGSTIDNPLVDVRAERRIGDVIAGVLVQGNVKSPKISLFSDPPFDDSNVLSYIILGKPIDAASDQDGQLLANAAVSLGLLGGEKLAKEIADQFGIDEIKIQSDQKTNSTSVVLGKYLSPDFYVGYAIGIGNAVDTLQIQYKLTEQWVLKTQSGEQQKAELLFTIESD